MLKVNIDNKRDLKINILLYNAEIIKNTPFKTVTVQTVFVSN